MHKKIIILEHNNGRLGNQLWNHISVLAYCLEKGHSFKNNSFYRYNPFFAMERPWFAFLPNFLAHRIYEKYVGYIHRHHARNIVKAGNRLGEEGVGPFYLPPTDTIFSPQKKKIEEIENSENTVFYFSGWLFRNPLGIKKFYSEIRQRVQFKKKTVAQVAAFMNPLRKQYEHIVGVHFRQGDYRENTDTALVFKTDEIRNILEEYLAWSKKSAKTTLFIICSDSDVDMAAFSGLNAVRGPGEIAEDMLALSLTDTIIGSNSTFGTFAAYYGNIPFILFEHEQIDWSFYTKKFAESSGTYFQNEKSYMTCY